MPEAAQQLSGTYFTAGAKQIPDNSLARVSGMTTVG